MQGGARPARKQGFGMPTPLPGCGLDFAVPHQQLIGSGGP
ncbi:conserved hypothetical protein [delta proteobacterium NaphS2]|nr:conserved hypothetical protein [delta proteobacterium NaphS2]